MSFADRYKPPMWLDSDFGRGKHARGKTLPTLRKEAEKMLEKTDEGSVGIYTAYATGDLLGYVIKTPERGVWFEAAERDEVE